MSLSIRVVVVEDGNVLLDHEWDGKIFDTLDDFMVAMRQRLGDVLE